jgi:hypothetical protein
MQEALVACAFTHPVEGASKSTTYLRSTAALFLFTYALRLDRFRIMEYLRDSLGIELRDIEFLVQ